MAYTIGEVTMQGFRGSRSMCRMRLRPGLNIFQGPNRSGKSTAANAVPWALLGGEIAKKELGPLQTRERVNWKTKNIAARDACVRVVLENAGTKVVIDRTGRSVSIDGVAADPLVALGLTLNSVPASVFMPQDAVRGLLSVEPKNRRLFLEQLAGLGAHQRLEEVLTLGGKAVGRSLDELEQTRAVIDAVIAGQVRARRADLEQALVDAARAGLTAQMCGNDGAPALADGAVSSLRALCNQFGLAAPELPDVARAEDLQMFTAAANRALDALDTANPLIGEQGKLRLRQLEVETHAAELDRLLSERDAVAKSQRDLKERHGAREDLGGQIEAVRRDVSDIDADVAQAGAHIEMLERSLRYFEKLTADRVACPFCTSCELSMPDVRGHVSAHLRRVGVELCQERRVAAEARARELEAAQREFDDLERREMALNIKIRDFTTRVSAEPSQDLRRVLDVKRKELSEESRKLSEFLTKRSEATKGVRLELEKVRTVQRIHMTRGQLAKLDALTHQPDYEALKNAAERAEITASVLKELSDALKKETQAAFAQAYAANKAEVQSNYARLVGRSDMPELRIEPDGWDIVAGGVPVVQIMNAGDLTGVALSIFLAAARKATHQAGFVILDDPAQNLDSEHKRRLAELLADLAKERQVIVTSTDAEFLAALAKAGTIKRQFFRFQPWDKEQGCVVEEVNGAA